mmetsp:Transcript_8392/g.9857  ORF Transcript_8392/g.9857 Transcript_8392/m.9857 type:complete len:85 (-) Transcript_8392:62-316(-)
MLLFLSHSFTFFQYVSEDFMTSCYGISPGENEYSTFSLNQDQYTPNLQSSIIHRVVWLDQALFSGRYQDKDHIYYPKTWLLQQT